LSLLLLDPEQPEYKSTKNEKRIDVFFIRKPNNDKVILLS